MTLSEIRELFYSLTYQHQVRCAAAEALRFINLALVHVGSWTIAQGPEQLVSEWSGTISNPDSDRRVFADLSGQPYPRVRRILAAERTNLESDDDPTLPVIGWAEVRNNYATELQGKPKLFLLNQRIGFIQPQNGVQVTVIYQHGLPALVLDADSPGQSSGVGEADKLPSEYQILVPSYAALLWATAEDLDVTRLRETFEEQKAQLASTARLPGAVPNRG